MRRITGASGGQVISPTKQFTLTAQTFIGNLWKLTQPYWASEERWSARGLLAAIVALTLGQVYLHSRLPDTTYVSIAHRPTLAALHVQRLALVPDGAGMRLIPEGLT